jgi:hypothetical protein
MGGHTHLGVDIRYLLDRAAVASAPVLRGDDAAISALAELLDELVLRVDDEGRVECGEAVPLHRDGGLWCRVGGQTGRQSKMLCYYYWDEGDEDEGLNEERRTGVVIVPC